MHHYLPTSMLVPPYLERSQGTIVTSANTILVNIQTAKFRGGEMGIEARGKFDKVGLNNPTLSK